MIELLQRIKKLTEDSFALGDTLDSIMLSVTEEAGEVAACISADQGRKGNRVPKEPTHVEAIDLAICAFSAYFASGGTMEQIEKIGNSKLDKWQLNIDNMPPKIETPKNEVQFEARWPWTPLVKQFKKWWDKGWDETLH